MFKSFLFLLFSALLAPACSDKVECLGVYHFHESFPQEWREAAQLGVDSWNKFGLSKVVVQEGDEQDRQCSFEVVSRDSQEYRDQTPRDGSGWAGISGGQNGAIGFCPDNWGPRYETPDNYASPFWGNDGLDEVQHIVMHELGHVHGLVHISEPGVMNPNELVPRLEYTDSDHVDCCKALSCSL